MTKLTVCLDFDGTLHPYTAGWVGHECDPEPPTEPARHFLADLAQRYRVVVLSARASYPAGVEAIEAWLRSHGLLEHVSAITARKPAAVAYIDDRAVAFTGDWASVLASVDVLATRPNGAGRAWSEETDTRPSIEDWLRG